MRWSVKIARVAGTEIRLHITFLLFLAWIGFAYYHAGGAEAALSGVVFITLLFSSVVLHELGHVAAARQFGIQTPDITLLPIGGVARLRRMPTEPLQEIAVAVAGPAVNVLVAVLVVLLAAARVTLGELLIPAAGAHLWTRLATVNLWLVLFNLIPAFPMDGGRVLRALIALRTPYTRATRIAAGIGQGLRVPVRISRPVLQPDVDLHRSVPVLRRVAGSGGREPQRCLEDGFETMQKSDSPPVPVVDSRRRRLVGILTVETVGELMMIRTAARASRYLGWRILAALRPHGVPQD